MPDDLFRDALAKQAAVAKAERVQAAAEAAPAAPDGELDALFRNFAARMPQSWVRPFFTLKRVEYEEETRYGFLNRKRQVWPKIRWDETRVASGWAIQQVGKEVNLGGTWDKVQEQVYGKHVLAISTEGEPFLAVTDDTGRVIVGGDWVIYGMPALARKQAMQAVVLGRPKGNLRFAILNELHLDHGSWPETPATVWQQATPNSAMVRGAATNGYMELPAYLTRVMAELLYSAGVRD